MVKINIWPREEFDMKLKSKGTTWQDPKINLFGEYFFYKLKMQGIKLKVFQLFKTRVKPKLVYWPFFSKDKSSDNHCIYFFSSLFFWGKKYCYMLDAYIHKIQRKQSPTSLNSLIVN